MKRSIVDKAIDALMGEAEFMSADDPRYKQLMQFHKKYGHMPPQAKKVHMGSPDAALAPRGTLQKNSLSLYIYDKLRELHELWTDSQYSDSASDDEMVGILEKALESEVEQALRAYKEWVTH